MAKLENFIENYLKNKKISDYEGWLALYGRDGEREYREAKAEADTAYATARAEHGARGAALAQNGLSGSGYSDYLNHVAYGARTESIARAHARRSTTREENERGYLAYLEGEAAKEEKAKADAAQAEEKVFSDLLFKRISDKSSAVTYLTTRGVARERAIELAEQSLSILRGSQSYHNQLIEEATALSMDYASAYNFAIIKGLPDEAARSVAAIASFATKQRYENAYYRY